MATGKGLYQYSILFTVEVTHTYYSGGTCRDLIVHPTYDCEKLMKGLSLELRATSTGFLIIYDVRRKAALLNYIAMNGSWTCLSFILRSTDVCFLNFTDLPMDLLYKTLYFSNTAGHLKTADKIFLHPGEYEKGAQSFPVFRSEKKVDLPDTDVMHVARVLDLSRKPLLTVSAERGSSYLYINLKSIPEGKYILEILEEPFKLVSREEFIYINMSAPALGFINIMLQDPEKQHADFYPVWNDVITTKHYLAAFESRATHWTYYMIFPDSREVNELFIKSTGNDFSFDGPEQVNIGNGVNAYQFISQQRIPLKEESPYRFRLFENKISGLAEEIVSWLPVAGPSQVLPMEGKIFSALYINV
jgi:hypothetical protein